MAIYLTVDGGTTNTRVYLVRDGKICDSIKTSIGARDGKAALVPALREAISALLCKNELCENDVTRIIASGMITSENGLCSLAHTSLPAGTEELNRTMLHTSIDEVSSIGWSFIRGVKAVGSSIEETDIIRGEETELMGILENYGEDALYILPGSHSKHMSVDSNGKITDFKTMMSGELFAAVINNTILKNSTDFEHSTLVPDMLLNGYDYAAEHGINESLFKVRILGNIFSATREDCYSFLMGVILCDEVKAIIRHPARRIIIGGQKQMKDALCSILSARSDKSVNALSDETVNGAVARGAVKIYELA